MNPNAGLEQGFTLAERPTGDGPLRLELVLRSGTARSDGEGGALLRAESGRELRYTGLVVVDAHERKVPATLHVARPNELLIEVADAGAAYPLTVDPLLPSDTFLPSDQAYSSLGQSVASAGDVNGDSYDDVIVGAPEYDAGATDEGAAFVFLGGPSGIANGNPTTANAGSGREGGGKPRHYIAVGAPAIPFGAPCCDRDGRPFPFERGASPPEGDQSGTIGLPWRPKFGSRPWRFGCALDRCGVLWSPVRNWRRQV